MWERPHEAHHNWTVIPERDALSVSARLVTYIGHAEISTAAIRVDIQPDG